MPEPFSVSKILSFWAEMGVINSSSLHFPLIYELGARKPVFGVSDHVQHKPGCATTEGS